MLASASVHESYEAVVVGAGQAGLAVGYHLARRGLSFVVLEAAHRVGEGWRRHYDSLRLFTPNRLNGLPGLPFPGPPGALPTRDEVADYLGRYAVAFALPVRAGSRVASLERAKEGYLVRAAGAELLASSVVIATGLPRPRVPPFARELAPSVFQLHSSAYRNPLSLPPGPVLVVGGGNSGAQIAEELSREREVTFAAGRGWSQVSQRLFDLSHRLPVREVPAGSLLGRRMQKGTPVIGVDLLGLERRGRLRLAGRVVGAKGTAVELEGGERLTVQNVVWATGYRADHSWVRLPVFGADGRLEHRGVKTALPGLYVVGLPWQTRMGSATLGGVGRDAEEVARRVEAHSRRASLARLEP